MKKLLKSLYNFSDYQIAQLEYFFKTIVSEVSKLIIMGIIFRNELPVYLVAIIALSILRISVGGLHCKTYLGCLFASTAYMYTCIHLLPDVLLPPMVRTILVSFCFIINYKIGPVTSDVHMPLTKTVIERGRMRATIFILLYAYLTCIIPESIYTIVVFWIIIIHTLQLFAAKIRKMKKGVRQA